MPTEVGDGMATEGKVIVIGDGEGDGIQIHSIHNRNIHNNHNTLTQIITDPLRWVNNINTRCPMNNTHPTPNRNSTIHRDSWHNRAKQQTCVNCVRIKAITIINGNLQATSWPIYKKPLIKGIHIIIKTRIKGNGQMGKMIIMTPWPTFSLKEDHDATDPPLRTLNVFYQGTNVEMLEETYLKFKKNILPKIKKMQPDFQKPEIEYCEPDQVIDICSYNHYPVLIIIIIYFYSTVSLHFSCTTIAMPLLFYYFNLSP